MDKRPYFHELPQETINDLIARKTTWQQIMDNYQQPTWCGYHEALNGSMGCWTLTDLTLTSHRTQLSSSFCADCEECIQNKVNHAESNPGIH